MRAKVKPASEQVSNWPMVTNMAIKSELRNQRGKRHGGKRLRIILPDKRLRDPLGRVDEDLSTIL